MSENFCERAACGCEYHHTADRDWSVNCRAHGGWLPSSLPEPPFSEDEELLLKLREDESALIDQVLQLQAEIEAVERSIAKARRKKERSRAPSRDRTRSPKRHRA